MRSRQLRFPWRQPFFLVVFASLVPWTVGCGGGKGKVEGTVTLDGQPLRAGNITFHASNGLGGAAQIKDGKYSIDKIASGSATVTVETETLKQEMEGLASSSGGGGMARSARGQMSAEMMAKMPPAAKEKMEQQQKAAEQSAERLKYLQANYRAVPTKYADPKTSPLKFDVKSGENTIDIPLTSQ